MLRTILLSALSLATAAGCQTPTGAPQQPVETTAQNTADLISVDYRLRSAINDREYRVSVLLPPGYNSMGDTRHPTFYAYDAVGQNREQLVQLSGAVAARTPDVIWVGIGPGSDQFWDAERAADTTPTPRPSFDADTMKFIAEAATKADKAMSEAQLEAQPGSGQSGVFLDILETEIIPLIETAYRTNGDRAIGGHSFSGLLAGSALLSKPDLFSRYLISSPSFWWDDYTMIERTAAFTEATPELNARVFLSVGGAESEDMLSSKRRFDELLRARGYTGLTLESREFEGASHGTVVLPAFLNGIPYLYADTQDE